MLRAISKPSTSQYEGCLVVINLSNAFSVLSKQLFAENKGSVENAPSPLPMARSKTLSLRVQSSQVETAVRDEELRRTAGKSVAISCEV
jgi:hypothetical protein